MLSVELLLHQNPCSTPEPTIRPRTAPRNAAASTINSVPAARILDRLETWPETGFSRVVSYTWGIKK